jgi:hypothetical protein
MAFTSHELVFGINKPLSGRVVLACSSPQKAEFLMYNWSFTPVEARADNDRSRVYLSHIPSKEGQALDTEDRQSQFSHHHPLHDFD